MPDLSFGRNRRTASVNQINDNSMTNIADKPRQPRIKNPPTMKIDAINTATDCLRLNLTLYGFLYLFSNVLSLKHNG